MLNGDFIVDLDGLAADQNLGTYLIPCQAEPTPAFQSRVAQDTWNDAATICHSSTVPKELASHSPT